MGQPVDLIARFRCAPGQQEAVRSLLGAYAAHVRSSPGALRFETYAEAEDGSAIVVVERYADPASFDAHLADPANDRFNRRLATLIAGAGSELCFLAPFGEDPC